MPSYIYFICMASYFFAFLTLFFLISSVSAVNEVNLSIDSSFGYCLTASNNSLFTCNETYYLVLSGTEDHFVYLTNTPIWTPKESDLSLKVESLLNFFLYSWIPVLELIVLLILFGFGIYAVFIAWGRGR